MAPPLTVEPSNRWLFERYNVAAVLPDAFTRTICDPLTSQACTSAMDAAEQPRECGTVSAGPLGQSEEYLAIGARSTDRPGTHHGLSCDRLGIRRRFIADHLGWLIESRSGWNGVTGLLTVWRCRIKVALIHRCERSRLNRNRRLARRQYSTLIIAGCALTAHQNSHQRET